MFQSSLFFNNFSICVMLSLLNNVPYMFDVNPPCSFLYLMIRITNNNFTFYINIYNILFLFIVGSMHIYIINVLYVYSVCVITFSCFLFCFLYLIYMTFFLVFLHYLPTLSYLLVLYWVLYYLSFQNILLWSVAIIHFVLYLEINLI